MAWMTILQAGSSLHGCLQIVLEIDLGIKRDFLGHEKCELHKKKMNTSKLKL